VLLLLLLLLLMMVKVHELLVRRMPATLHLCCITVLYICLSAVVLVIACWWCWTASVT
jgi:hypothetical protein